MTLSYIDLSLLVRLEGTVSNAQADASLDNLLTLNRKEIRYLDKKAAFFLKIFAFLVLFCGAVYFENTQRQRLILLIVIFVLLVVNGFVRSRVGNTKLYYYLSFYLDIAFIFALEQNSRLLINYFFHFFYILILLEAVWSLKLRRGLTFGAVALLVSMIKYGMLVYYKFNFANLSQMAFFLLVNALILVVAGFAQHNREEREKKDLLYKELLDTHRKLKRYADEISRLSVVEERSRIARDLHDTLGHNMTALIMQLQMTEHLMGEDRKRAETLLADALKSARESLTGIREVVETLRGEKLSIEAAKNPVEQVRRLTDAFANKTGAVIRFEADGVENFALDPKNTGVNVALYHIVQEALTNAVRHGKATEIQVSLECMKEEIRFSVSDNGNGLENPENIVEGFGLKGIKERVQAHGGQLQYKSEGGFTVWGNLCLEDKND